MQNLSQEHVILNVIAHSYVSIEPTQRVPAKSYTNEVFSCLMAEIVSLVQIC
jgi:hypothetical protein